MKLLTFMMNLRQMFSFLTNVLIFLIDRLYKEWEYMLGRGQSNYSEEAFRRGDLFAKQLIGYEFGKNDSYEMKRKRRFSYGIASVVFGKALLTGFNSLHQINICSVTEERNRLFIKITMGRGPITYKRQIVYRLGNFVQKAYILISLTDIKVSGDFSAEKETGRNGFLLNFAVNKLNGFKLSVNGFGYFDWAINLLLSFWRLILGRIFRNLLEWELQQFVLGILPNLKFPVEVVSYRNETKLEDERVRNNEAFLSESYDAKQSLIMPKWPMSPISKSSINDGHSPDEYGDEEDLGSNLDITNIGIADFPETDKWLSERNKFDRLLKRYPSSETSDEIYLDEVSGNENVDSGNFVSKLSAETDKLTKSFEIMEKTLDFISSTTKSFSKDIAFKNCLEILNEDKRNMNSASSLPAKGLKEQLVISEEKSVFEDFPNKLRDSCTELETASVENENFGQSELHEEYSGNRSFSEIQEPSNKGADGNSFNMVIKASTRVANCEQSPSTKSESPQIHKNILERSTTETGLFIKTPDMDSKGTAQINHLKNGLNGKKRKERTKDSNKNPVLVESFNNFQSPEETCSARNSDLHLGSTKLFQDELKNEKSLINFTVDEFEEYLKAPDNAFPGVECHIKDPEPAKSYCTERNRSVKSPKTQYISNPKDKVDGRNLLGSNVTSDSMLQKMIQDEKSFGSEVDTQIVSTSLHLNEKHEHKVNEKIPIEYVKVYTEKLNEDSHQKANIDYSVVDFLSKDLDDSSLLHPVFASVSTGFPVQNLDLCRSDSLNYITNDLSEENSLTKEMARLNEGHDECMDFGTDNSNFTRFSELHEEVFPGTCKMPSDTLESDPEDDVCSSRKNPESTKNLDPKNKSICNELNQFRREDPKLDIGVVSFLEDGNTLSLVKELSTPKNENLREFKFSSESDTETSSETE